MNENNKQFMKKLITGIINLIPVIVAVWTIYHTTNAWKEDRFSKRAYFAIGTAKDKEQFQATDISPDKSKVHVALNLNLQNLGMNPAEDFNIVIYIINKKSSNIEKLKQELYFPNDFAPNYSHDPGFNFLFPYNYDPVILVFELNYFDPILNSPFKQTFFYDWNGIHDGIPFSKFNFSTKSDVEKYKEIIQKKWGNN